MKVNIPAKALTTNVISQIALDTWPFDDGTSDPYWAGGVTPKPYRWELTMTVTTQDHGSHLTRSPKVYTGLDIKVGDWIAGAATGLALQIISVRSKTDSTAVCVVEDILRYNTFRSSIGEGLFSVPGPAIIFELNEDGDPVIDPIAVGTVAATSFVANLASRMKAFHREDVQILEELSNGFAEGNLISIDSTGTFVKTSTATMDSIVGTVSASGPSPNLFLLRPITKILENYEPALPGSAGDLIYAATTTGSDLTTDKTPFIAFIQLTDPTPTALDSTVANGTTTTGNEVYINGTLITFNNDGGGTESIDDAVVDINAESGTTGVIASKVVIARTSAPDLVYGVVGSIITAPGPASALINSSLVTFNDDSFGQYEFGSGIANEQDLANSINNAAITDIEAYYNHEELVIVDTSGTGITIFNVSNDASGNPFAGPSSNSGVPLSNTDTFLRLSRADGGEIIVQNETGDPIGDFGMLSGQNGKLPLALVTEQGIRRGEMYVVANITARDALDVLVGDQAYVLDKGDGEWGMYLATGNSPSPAWSLTGTQESSTVDSASVSILLTPSTSTGIVPIKEVNDGSRVTVVTVEVTVPFDGSPTLTIGDDAGDAARLMTDDQLDLSVADTYASTPSYHYMFGTDVTIVADWDSGGSTTGSALVTITYS